MDVTPGLLRSRQVGAALVLVSAAFFGLTGVLTKTIAADAWTIACWRGLVGCLVITAYVRLRGNGRPGARLFVLNRQVWLLAFVGAAASVAFISAFKSTYVANVAVIYATAPFLAALLERIMLGEPFRRNTMVAAAVSLCGVAVIVGGSLGSINLVGDALALLMTVLSALYMVLIRSFRDAPVVWAGALSGLVVFVLGWLVASPGAIGAADIPFTVLFGLTFATALILWTEGTRFIPAAESGLVGSAEIPFAVVFASLLISEIPPATTIVGGAVIIAAVVWSSTSSISSRKD